MKKINTLLEESQNILRTKKVMGRVWRVNRTTNYEEIKWITGWNVENDLGEFVEGGFQVGNNYKSGYPIFRSKKEAEDWIKNHPDAPPQTKEKLYYRRNWREGDEWENYEMFNRS